MTYLEFFSEHFVLAFFVICSVYYIARIIFYSIPVRLMRTINIWKHGYPPIHCDADGDFKPEEESK